jgi:hypothetical protein
VSDLDPGLRRALAALAAPGRWATLATVGPGGWPHATPVLAGLVDGVLVASVTGRQKQRNLERDSRATLVFAVDGSLAHLVVQGRMVLRHDEEAVRLRRALLTEALGEEGLVAWDRPLSPDGSRLGVMAPERWRAYGLTDQAPA